MTQEQNDRKHLTARQIVNRFRKGEYVDESLAAIASAVAASGESFNSVAVPFPQSIIERVGEHIVVAKTFYERQKAGLPTDDIELPDYPQLRELLTDLSHPAVWEMMQKGAEVSDYWDVLYDRKLYRKYHLDVKASSMGLVTDLLWQCYKTVIENIGLSYATFEMMLYAMFQRPNAYSKA